LALGNGLSISARPESNASAGGMDCSAPSNPPIIFARVPMDSATPDEQLVIDLSLQALKRAIAESKAAMPSSHRMSMPPPSAPWRQHNVLSILYK
jgi:hypothetical protein